MSISSSCQNDELEIIQVILEDENPQIKKFNENTVLTLTLNNLKFTNPMPLSTESINDLKIHYLPPTMLRFTLPKEYPEKVPLKFEILCDDYFIIDDNFCDEFLDDEKFNHLPVIYDIFIEFKECLGVILENPDTTKSSKIKLNHKQIYQNIRFLKNYNDNKLLEIFNNSKQECMFCYGKFQGSKLVRCHAESDNTIDFYDVHYFCQDCLVNYWKSGLEDFNSWRLDEKSNMPICPYADTDMHILLPITKLKNPEIFPDQEIFKKFDEMLLSKALDKLSTKTVICPRIDCKRTIYIDQNDTTMMNPNDLDITCPYCTFSFCSSCYRSAHSPLKCSDLVSYKVSMENILEKEFQKMMDEKKNESDEFKKSMTEGYSWVRQLLGADDIHSKKDHLKNKFVGKISSSSDFDHISGMTRAQLIENLKASLGDKQFNYIMYEVLGQDLSLTLIKETCMACPKCLMPIEKNMGCNHMYCTNCKNSFNYKGDGLEPVLMSKGEYVDKMKETRKNL